MKSGNEYNHIIFERVIVIGYGVVSKDVLETVYNSATEYNYIVEYIEHEIYPFNVAKVFAESNDIECYTLENNDILLNHFLKLADRSCMLIISAGNNYIFPKELIQHKNITIINFHNALLPAYPGRNAPSWVIYNDEKKTGITWYYVSDIIDGGNIIIQKDMDVSPDVKAYELAAALMKLARVAFDECFDMILSGKAHGNKQDVIIKDRKLYKACETPGQGVFSLRDDPSYIYRLLRALDYGKNALFPLPACEFDGKLIRIKRYKIVEDKKAMKNRLFIPFGGKFIMLCYGDVS